MIGNGQYRERGGNLDCGGNAADLVPAAANLSEALPEGWSRLTIGAVTETSRLRKETLPRANSQIPFIPMALLPEDGATTTRWEMRNPNEIRSGVGFVEGDVLLAKITPCLENGKLGLARGIPGGWGMTSTEVCPLRPTKVTADFLAAYLSHPAVRHSLASKMQGATGRQRLPKEALDSFPIPVPPLPEQRAIAAVLRTVQQAKEACERVIAATRQLKQSLLHHLFTYGPAPFDQADQVPLKETDIGQIPEHWQIANLGSYAEHSAFGPRFSGDLYDLGGNVATLRTTDISDDGRINYATMPRAQIADAKFAAHFLTKGDFLVTRSGTCGIATVFEGFDLPVLAGAFLIRFVLKSGLSPYFLRDYFNSPVGRVRVETIASGAVQKNISGTSLKAFLVPIPPLFEQQLVAAHLSAVDAKLAAEESRRAALDNLFKSLLHYLITGKLRLPEFVGNPA